MASAELDTLLSSTPPSQKAPHWNTAASILSLLRKAHLYRPSLVLMLGETVRRSFSPVSRDHWDVVAQICEAATDLGETQIAKSVFDQIYERFPHSVRTFVLLGRRHEARCDWDSAMKNYVDVIHVDPMAPMVYKRQIAVLHSQMKIPEAISMLNYYLTYHQDDMEAWAELCALCLSQGKLSNALFAANEIVINDPNNHAAQTLVADVYMTCTGKDNVLLARKHYSSSLMARKKGNLRALYGMWLSCSVLKDNKLLDTDEESERNDQILSFAKLGISAIYKSASTEPYTHVTKVLDLDIVSGKMRK